MPVVFVHGVGTRTSPDYWADLEMRKRLMRDFLFRPLGLPETSEIHFAYWGDQGATFRWGHASLPSGGDEALGAPVGGALVEALGEYVDVESESADGFIAAVARERGLEDALDMMIAAAAEGATAEQAEALTAVFKATVDQLGGQPPDWLEEIASDPELLTALFEHVDMQAGGDEAFGSSAARGWSRLRERLGRLRTAVPAAIGRTAGKFVRPRIHDQAATFIGDILVYLQQIGADGADAAILTAVGDSIDKAAIARTEVDPLVVIAHSMGGNIVYDLLSNFRPERHVNVLITVGSQVGVFQELDLFSKRYPDLRPPRDKVPKPQNIDRWINVYDRNDVLGFSVGRIFEDTTDFEYSTGMGLVKSHSSYFIRPSFYRRLAVRLEE